MSKVLHVTASALVVLGLVWMVVASPGAVIMFLGLAAGAWAERLEDKARDRRRAAEKAAAAAAQGRCWYCNEAGHADGPCPRRREHAELYARKGRELYGSRRERRTEGGQP